MKMIASYGTRLSIISYFCIIKFLRVGKDKEDIYVRSQEMEYPVSLWNMIIDAHDK